MQTVYVEGGVVRVAPVPVVEGYTLADCYHPDYVSACVQVDDSVQVGWVTQDGGKTFAAPAPTPIAIPQSVSSAQAKIQCLRTPGSEDGKTLLDDITAAVQKSGGEAQIWFTEARTWERNNPYVESLSSSLQLKPADVDRLFTEAAQIAA